MRDFFRPRGPRMPLRTGLTAIAALLAVIVVSAAVAWDGDVPAWEQSVLEFFNAWPEFLKPLMWVLQQPGVLFFPVIAGAVIALTSHRWYYLLPFALLPVYKLTVEKGVIKGLVDRTRPYDSIGPQINARGDSDLDGLSFPSGHTTTAVASGLLIAAFLPRKWRPLAIGWGLFVGIARLYFGEHNFLDVVAGTATGTTFAIVAYLLFINRWIAEDNGNPIKANNE